VTTSDRSVGAAAVRDAVTLGSSLFIGVAMTLAVRLVVPRVLGPSAFGALRVAETAADMVLVILTLGVDTVIRRDGAGDAARVQGTLGALARLRTIAGIAIIAAIASAMHMAGQEPGRVAVFVALGAGQLLLALSNSHAALEHASGNVRWVARTTLACKALWVLLALAAMALVPSAAGLALALLAAEAVRFVVMRRRHVSRERGDTTQALAIIAAGMPFFINFLAHSAYGRLGTWWIAGTAGDQEAGWYGAAANVSALALLGMPLVSWVLIPSGARAARTGEAATLLAGALRLALLLVVPFSLVLALIAPWVVPNLFGASFAPAALALRLLAPTVALAYVSTICATGLIHQERVGVVTKVSIAGLVVSMVANALLVPWGQRTLGPGGAAAGAAAATLVTELVVTVALVRLALASTPSTPLRRTAIGLTAATLCTVIAAVLLPGAPIGAAVLFLLVLATSGAVKSSDYVFLINAFRRSETRVPTPS